MITESFQPSIVAEIGASHNGSFERAMDLVGQAKICGADAVKFQCFTPESMTLDCCRPEFIIQDGPWKGMKLYELYTKAAMPWEWFPKLFGLARELGLVPFSSVFDKTSIDFLESLDCPAYKISSFECIDIPLIKYAASKGKPLLISTGMATITEMDDAFVAATEFLDETKVCMLHCISSYPCPPEEAGLLCMDKGDGLSDHTIGSEAAIAATVLGAPIIEKHLTLSRNDGGLDDGFASEPHEFAAMVKSVRIVKAMLTKDAGQSQLTHKPLRRSLYVVKPIARGEKITEDNVRSIRPANGLPPVCLDRALQLVAARDLEVGTPLSWDLLEEIQ